MKLAYIRGRFVAIRAGRVFISRDIRAAFNFLKGGMR